MTNVIFIAPNPKGIIIFQFRKPKIELNQPGNTKRQSNSIVTSILAITDIETVILFK
jgi:hypothetical protein